MQKNTKPWRKYPWSNATGEENIVHPVCTVSIMIISSIILNRVIVFELKKKVLIKAFSFSSKRQQKPRRISPTGLMLHIYLNAYF